MTIFKLVDRDTGDESVEYDPQMVFQRACPSCIHLKVWSVWGPVAGMDGLSLGVFVRAGFSVSLGFVSLDCCCEINCRAAHKFCYK